MLDLLENRTSVPAMQLSEPGPDKDELENILRCGLTAPDHAGLRSWRFITISGTAREALGEVFERVAIEDTPDMPPEKLARIKQKPLRAPLIVVIVATITENHPKTPEVEQVLSAGAATTLVQLAATQSGYGSHWLTGPNAYHPTVKKALGVASKDQIVGFIYIGTPPEKTQTKKRPDLAEHLSDWSGPLS